MSRIMILDLETQNHTYFGAKASPRHPDNYVVACGWCVDKVPYDGAVEYTYHTQREDFLHIPSDVNMLVAHNAPFEMDWFLVQQREEIMRFLEGKDSSIRTPWGAVEALRSLADKVERSSKM